MIRCHTISEKYTLPSRSTVGPSVKATAVATSGCCAVASLGIATPMKTSAVARPPRRRHITATSVLPALIRTPSGQRSRISRVLASLSAFKPPSQRRLCFARTATCKKTCHTDVFIQIGPVDALTLANESPACPLGLATVSESRVPRQRNADSPTIDKVDHQNI